MNTNKAIEYKHLKEGDIITCEGAGYADFRVGQRCKVLKDDSGLYLSDGAGGKMYLYEMFKWLDNDTEVVYCMCKGAFIFYKEMEKEGTKPDTFSDIYNSITNDFTEDELKRLYSGIEELKQQIKLDRNKSKIRVGEVWRCNPIEFEIVGIEKDEDEISAVLLEEDGGDIRNWIEMPEFLEHYSPCNPPDTVIHVDADKVKSFCDGNSWN